jgi:hypothetical protein
MTTLTTFEETLTVPFAGNAALEELRYWLLQDAMTPADNTLAARYVFRAAFRGDLGVVLKDLTPAPTPAVKATSLSTRTPLVTLVTNLRRKCRLEAAINEAHALGLPEEHQRLVLSYEGEDDPSVWLNTACVITCVAKLLS